MNLGVQIAELEILAPKLQTFFEKKPFEEFKIFTMERREKARQVIQTFSPTNAKDLKEAPFAVRRLCFFFFFIKTKKKLTNL